MASSTKRQKLGDFAERKTTSEPRQPVTLSSLGLSGVLPRGITEQDGLPCFPCRPAQLPVNPSETLLVDGLKRLNGHPRDKHITFEAGKHAYFWKGERVTRSVTQMVHEFKNEFSEDYVISSMQTSTNWPRPGYLKSTLSEHQKAELVHGLKDAEQLLMEFQREERDELRICKLAHQLRARTPKSKAIAEMVTGLGLSEAEIREKWAKARDDGAKEGTWMHAQFECLLNGGSLPCQTAEVTLLARFLGSQRDTIAYRTEWQVYADDEDIAGSIDYVAERPDGSKVIVDWKRTRRPRLSDEAFGKLMQGPLCGVPDCTLWHYRLQLNLYRFILEKYYGLTVSCMYIVGTNPDNGDQPYVDEVPRLKPETEALMRHWATHKRHATWKTRAGHDEMSSSATPYCQCVPVQAPSTR